MVRSLLESKNEELTVEDRVAMIQAGDKVQQDRLIHDYKPFIGKTVSTVCCRYIHESDDEFSIGLIAFNEAIYSYRPEKESSFLSFVKLLIQRRLIDFLRKQSKQESESLDDSIENDEDRQRPTLEVVASVDEYNKKIDEEKRKEEIIHFTNLLEQYELSLQELFIHSPKQHNARKNAIIIAKRIAENEQLRTTFLRNKRLPIKELESHVSVSRKTIERNRKYIIAIVLILINDYAYLKDYLKGVLDK